MLTYILAGICSLIFLAADQITKNIVAESFVLGEQRDFINGFINLFYTHNNGGAWGFLAGQTWALLAITAIIMVICITLLVCKGSKNPWLFWSVSLILSGGVGNMIDRIFNGGMVIDFLQFAFWPTFPIFNVADCAIVIGCCILLIYFTMDVFNDYKKRKNLSNVG